MSRPLISVIVPSYNQAQYLGATLESIIEQDIPGLELIVIDGGSNDSSLEVIRRFERHIAYWVSEKDRGQSHALNKGLAVARGEYIGWQNSDDLYAPNCLRLLAARALADRRVPIVSGHLKVCDQDGRVFRSVMYTPISAEELPFVMATLPNQSALIRADAIREVGGFNESMRYCMDLDLWARLLKRYGGRNSVVRGAYGIYRVHPFTKTSTMIDVHHVEREMISRSLLSDERFLSATKLRVIARKVCAHMALGHWAYLLRKITDRAGLTPRSWDIPVQ